MVAGVGELLRLLPKLVPVQSDTFGSQVDVGLAPVQSDWFGSQVDVGFDPLPLPLPLPLSHCRLPLPSDVQLLGGVAPSGHCRLPVSSNVQVGSGVGVGQLLPLIFFLWPWIMQLTVGFFGGSLPTWFHAAPVNGGFVEKVVGVGENTDWAKEFQIFAGQKPPKPPPPSMDRLSFELLSCELVNMPTTSEYCDVAPMKKPEWELVVVPVLPMTVPGVCWP